MIIKDVRFKNFFSFGETFSHINFNSFGSTLIIGRNGGGKSSALIEPITFGLYGKPYKKIKKSTLVNDRNNKNCLVEIDLEINSDSYLIRRGIKPNVFEIFKNGVLINQDAASRDYQEYLEDSILKMSYMTFCNTVAISVSTYTSFFKFSAQDRRKFIEEILSLNIFSVMNDLNKKNLVKLKADIEESKTNILLTKSKLDYTVSYIKKIQEEDSNNKSQLTQELNLKINSLKLELEELNSELVLINSQIQISSVDSTELNKLTKTLDTLKELSYKTDIKIENYEKELNQIQNLDHCNSCGQSITLEWKESKLKEVSNSIADLKNIKSELELKTQTATNEREHLLDRMSQLNELQNKRNQLTLKHESIYTDINSVESELIKLDSNVNISIETEKDLAKQLLAEYRSLLDNKEVLLSELEYLDYCSEILKDSGIKANIIQHYIPIITNKLNYYLNKFGFNCRLEFDSEFNETLYYNGFQERSYYNFSAGEMLRIDLCTLLTWRYVSKIQKNSECNVLILDEILDGSLEQPGIDMFLEILKEEGDINLFVISHNAEKYTETFTRELKFIKESGYSKIIEK